MSLVGNESIYLSGTFQYDLIPNIGSAIASAGSTDGIILLKFHNLEHGLMFTILD